MILYAMVGYGHIPVPRAVVGPLSSRLAAIIPCGLRANRSSRCDSRSIAPARVLDGAALPTMAGRLGKWSIFTLLRKSEAGVRSALGIGRAQFRVRAGGKKKNEGKKAS